MSGKPNPRQLSRDIISPCVNSRGLFLRPCFRLYYPLTNATFCPLYLEGIYIEGIMDKTLDFWIAVGVVMLVKIKTSPRLGFWQVASSLIVAMGAAYVGAEYASSSLGVPESIAGALVALTAEGIMRWVLTFANNPREFIDLWKYWKAK